MRRETCSPARRSRDRPGGSIPRGGGDAGVSVEHWIASSSASITAPAASQRGRAPPRRCCGRPRTPGAGRGDPAAAAAMHGAGRHHDLSASERSALRGRGERRQTIVLWDGMRMRSSTRPVRDDVIATPSAARQNVLAGRGACVRRRAGLTLLVTRFDIRVRARRQRSITWNHHRTVPRSAYGRNPSPT